MSAVVGQENMKKDLDSELITVAYHVADEYRDGLFSGMPKDWNATWTLLCKELERRCPGFTREEYGAALEDGFVASR